MKSIKECFDKAEQKLSEHKEGIALSIYSAGYGALVFSGQKIMDGGNDEVKFIYLAWSISYLLGGFEILRVIERRFYNPWEFRK